MKCSSAILKTTIFISLIVLLFLNANAQGLNEGQKMKDQGSEYKLEFMYETPDANNVRRKSDPKLRPVEVIQQGELAEYEAAGQIPSPYIKNGVTQGWLVNSCIILAPRHAIIGNGNVDKNLTNIEVDFKVGYQGKNNFKQDVKIKPISCGRGNDGEDMGGEDFCTRAGSDYPGVEGKL